MGSTKSLPFSSRAPDSKKNLTLSPDSKKYSSLFWWDSVVFAALKTFLPSSGASDINACPASYNSSTFVGERKFSITTYPSEFS